MFKLFNVIVGTAVIAELVAPIVTSSLAAGTPLVQLPPMVHKPPVARFQVVDFALQTVAVVILIKKTSIILRTNELTRVK
jgi:hypothetical protein